jgi:hypothetical protein
VEEQHQIRAKLQDPGSMDEVPTAATKNSSTSDVRNSCGVEQEGRGVTARNSCRLPDGRWTAGGEPITEQNGEEDLCAI